MTNNQSRNIFQPKSIKDVFFSVNENLINADREKELRLEITIQFGHNIENNLASFTITAFYQYTGAEKDSPKLAQIDVQNIFEVDNMIDFVIKDNVVSFPPFLIIQLVSLSISHTRALFFKNLSGTSLQAQIMSRTDPEDVARHFFPYMFNSKPDSTGS